MSLQTGDHDSAASSLKRAEAERALLRALLVDAVRCLFGECGGPPSKRARLIAEARRWIAMTGDSRPFSFENVCGWLGLPASRLRRTLLERAGSDATVLDGPRRRTAFAVGLRRERNNQIRALRKAGAKPREIAERVGLAYTSILQICAAGEGHGQPEAGLDDGLRATAAGSV